MYRRAGLDLRGLLEGQCPRCLAKPSEWRTKGDCHVCGTGCCSECSVEDQQGLVCAPCVAVLVERLMADGDVVEVLS